MLISLYNMGTLIYSKGRNNLKLITDPTSPICNPKSPENWKFLSWLIWQDGLPRIGMLLLIAFTHPNQCECSCFTAEILLCWINGFCSRHCWGCSGSMWQMHHILSGIPTWLNSETYLVRGFWIKELRSPITRTPPRPGFSRDSPSLHLFRDKV